MKQRILSGVLVLCLCISSQSAVYAYQKGSLPQEDVFMEGSEDERDTNDGMITAPPEDPSLPEDLLPPEDDLPEEPEDDPEDLLPPEDDLPEEPEDDPEDLLPPEDDLPEEPEDDPEDLLPPEDDLPEESEDDSEDLLPPEDDLLEESEDELDSSEDKITGLTKALSVEEDNFPKYFTYESGTRDGTIPTPTEAYNAMIALKEQDQYREETVWTDYEPYSDSRGYYRWKGGTLDGKNIVGVGCVAFAFTLSDAAFGSLPARMYAPGGFEFKDIKVGDILRVNTDTHTVIVLEVSDVGVVIAEGNYSGKVHWGRTMSKEEVMSNTSHYITRYPEGYVSPDDPAGNESIGNGILGGDLIWNLTNAGTLTISGSGAMPDFGSTGEQPWSEYSSQIRKVVIEEGVTGIGSCAFRDCGVLSVEIPSSVTAIGNSAFLGSSIISVTIPSSVKTIGDSAFRECQGLSSVTLSEGLETIEQNAFRACTSLTSIELPASIGEVGAGVFFQCTAMTNATFASGSKRVIMGDNMFTQCYSLMGVTLPQSINCIGNEMFMNCGMLTGVEIPQGAESIGNRAFASCSGLTVVIIPDSVTTIGSAAFSDCSLTDIYFTGTETQWNGIDKIGDTASAVLEATIHYEYSSSTDPGPDDGDDSGGDDSDNPGENNSGNSGGNKPGNNYGDTSSENIPGSISSEDASNNKGFNSDKAGSSFMASSVIGSDIEEVEETWEPKTPDEIKRYACMGKEAIQYTISKDNSYQILMENAMQGPMCFKSFEAVLGDYMIGRTYNIYASSSTAYSMDKEIQFTVKIPPDIYKKNRDYKMICVTKGGQPIIYNDLDNNPETITIKTNKFYAYALIYKQK